MRIVSLLPAATDLVAVLGAAGELVGCTHECDWPPGELSGAAVLTGSSLAPDRMTSREISDAVGGAHRGSALYQLDVARLAGLDADLVLTQDLCPVCAISYESVSTAIRSLPGDSGPRVLSLEPRTLDEVLDCVRLLGAELDRAAQAGRVLAEAGDRLAAVRSAVAGRPRPRVAAIEWLDPLWPAGHWVPEQIEIAGGIPLLASKGEHTRPVGMDALSRADPDVIVLLPCGLTPDRTEAELSILSGHPQWNELAAVRAGRVWVADGPAYFNRPGPRVVRGVEVLAELLHEVPFGLVTSEARPVARGHVTG